MQVEMNVSADELNRAFKTFAEDDPAGLISMENLKRLAMYVICPSTQGYAYIPAEATHVMRRYRQTRSCSTLV